MNTTTTERGPSLEDRPTVPRPLFGRWMGQLKAAAHDWRRQLSLLAKRHRDIRHISGFTDGQLHDIGLLRSEILDVIMHGKAPVLIAPTT
jgi:hypothetical protein